MKTTVKKNLNRLTALAMLLMLFFGTAYSQPTHAASNPYFSGVYISGLTTNNATINTTVKNPSRMRLVKCGYILYNSKGKAISNRYDKINYTYSSFKAWYNLKEYGVKLSPGTNYRFKFYVTNSGKRTYYSGLYSFKTAPKKVNPSFANVHVSHLSPTNAQFNAVVKDPARTRLVRVGVNLYNSSGKCIATKYDNINYTYTQFNAWFNMNEYGVRLSPNTRYMYNFYVKDASGASYSTGKAAFTTPKAAASNTYTARVNSFLNDGRWKNGTGWGYYQAPKLSSYQAIGCCAYTADFTQYVFGKQSYRNCTGVFYNANSIKAGDVIYIQGGNTGGQHWLVVVSRNGNTLQTAEGNCSSKVRVSTSAYSVSSLANNYSYFAGYHMQ